MPSPLKTNRKLFWKLLILILFLTFFSVFFLSQTIKITEESSGKGSAINVSGSLRMQSYVMALTVAQSASKPPLEKHDSIMEAVDEFQRRLLSPGLVNAIPKDKDNPLNIKYTQLKDSFYNTIKPLAEQACMARTGREEFLSQIPAFVKNVDTFVFDLENELENRVDQLIFWLNFIIGFAILIGVCLPLYLSKTIFKPLHELSDLADRVRHGDFSQKCKYEGDNEIGILSKSFNFMVADLSTLYSNLEEKVRIKTQDLDNRNKTLRLLYQLRSYLDSHEMNKQTLLDSLKLISDFFNARSLSLVFLAEAGAPLQLGARFCEDPGLKSFKPRQFIKENSILFDAPFNRSFEYEGKKYAFWSQPLSSSEKNIGSLLLITEDDSVIKNEAELLKNIASIFFSMIERTNQHEENFRLALFEERSTIARELHDSIAQSLAFSKIQLTRLSYAIADKKDTSAIEGIIQELKEGVSMAYKQLREVLTTFRAVPQSKDFYMSVREILDDFRARTDVPYVFDNQVTWFELSPNQQVHLLQILREALSNITKHAHATEVDVIFRPTEEGHIELLIKDNGVGFDLKDRTGHFGLGIMRERANAMGGTLYLERNTPKGTQIRLNFVADSKDD